MSVFLKASGASFSKFVATTLPPGIEAASIYSVFGGTAEDSIRNRVPGANVHGSILGAPNFGASDVAINSAGIGFDYNIVAGNPFTYAIVATRVTTGPLGGILCGHYYDSPAGQKMDGIYDSKPANPGYAALIDFNSRGNIDGPENGNFNFVASAYDGHNGTVYVGSSGSLLSSSHAFDDPTPAGVRSFRVGATGFTGSSGNDGAFRAAAVLVFPTIVAQAGVVEIYAYFHRLMAQRGIVLN